MENFITAPKKVRYAISHNHVDQEKPNNYRSQVFMVVNAKTQIPQHFFQTYKTEYEAEHGFGTFFNYDVDPLIFAPVDIMDRETALYLIGQDAISRALNNEKDADEGFIETPSFKLVPVFGAMIPNCLTLNSAQ